MRISTLALIAALLLSTPAPALAQDYVINVNGIVCEFCAFGVTKKVAKLPFIDNMKLILFIALIAIYSIFLLQKLKPQLRFLHYPFSFSNRTLSSVLMRRHQLFLALVEQRPLSMHNTPFSMNRFTITAFKKALKTNMAIQKTGLF